MNTNGNDIVPAIDLHAASQQVNGQQAAAAATETLVGSSVVQPTNNNNVNMTPAVKMLKTAANIKSTFDEMFKKAV